MENIVKDFDLNELLISAAEKFNEFEKLQVHLNIMVAGKTGVGKSTLINAVFGSNVAKTGSGKPVTQHLEEFNNHPRLSIYDTKGLELDEQSRNAAVNEIIATVDNKIKTNDINQAIHCLWYCIGVSSNRIEQIEIDILRKLSEETQLPIIIVLTKCYAKTARNEMLQALKEENLNVADIISVHAIDYEVDDNYTVSAFGVKELIKKTAEILPEAVKTAFIRLQQADIDAKIEHARSIVNKYVITASGLAATPIPFSDAFTLIPTQIGMIAHVTTCFGQEIDKSIITGFVSAVAGTTATTFVGRTIVTNVLKFIPGIGSLTGGAIAATTAGALTKALGEAYILLMVEVAKGNFSLSDITSGNAKDFIIPIIQKILGDADLKELIENIISKKN